MKKFTFSLFLFLVSCCALKAQNILTAHQMDSLNKLLAQPNLPDTIRCDVLFWLGSGNHFIQPHEAVKYFSEALALARKIHNKPRVIGNLLTLGYLYSSIGESAKSIDMLQEGQHYLEDLHEDTSMALAFIANGYEAQGEIEKAIGYSRTSYLVYERNRNSKIIIDERGYPAGPMRMGQLFEKANQLDSAMFYAQMAYTRIQENKKNWEGTYFYCQICNLLGKLYSRKNENKEALKFYKLAYAKAIEVNYTSSISECQSFLAEFYFKNNQPDSVIFHATKAYTGAKQLNNFDIMKTCTAMLRQVYEKQGKFDKALFYNDLSIAARDSVYGVEKVREVQNLTHKEERRQEQKAQEAVASDLAYKNRIRLFSLLALLSGLGIIAFILFRNNRQKQKANSILHAQKEEINEKSQQLEKSLTTLKATQNQLIQSEKLASLGELTAGIAHEIQNPLNFVNNFSELSVGIAKDLNNELNQENIDKEYVAELLTDLTSNQEKINHHGKRASSIVKGMLEHSRAETGVKEMTDVNKLCDEYFRLAYNGLRSKDKNFNADMVSHYDATLPKIGIVPQDIGRVVLNLVNNAFYAVSERGRTDPENGRAENLLPLQQITQPSQIAVGAEDFLPSQNVYNPTVTVQTLLSLTHIEIRVKDNGTGMPDAVREKIFQPFFTTKPTGSGTGLGLSLAYDIVTKGHGGTFKVESMEGVGSEFVILLPI